RTMSGSGASNTLSSNRSMRRVPPFWGTWGDAGDVRGRGHALGLTPREALAPPAPEPAKEPEPAPAPPRAGALAVPLSLVGTRITASRITRACARRSLIAGAAVRRGAGSAGVTGSAAVAAVARDACVAAGATRPVARDACVPAGATGPAVARDACVAAGATRRAVAR